MLEFPRIAPLERVAKGMSIPEYKAWILHRDGPDAAKHLITLEANF